MNKKLINAVKHNLGTTTAKEFQETCADIANHGVDGGFGGFIYYTDTVKFFKKNRAEIIELVKETADSLGEEPIQMVAQFNCLGGQLHHGNQFPKDREKITADAMREYGESVARCLYGGRLTDDDQTVANALAWFAAEEVARHITDQDES